MNLTPGGSVTIQQVVQSVAHAYYAYTYAQEGVADLAHAVVDAHQRTSRRHACVRRSSQPSTTIDSTVTTADVATISVAIYQRTRYVQDFRLAR